MLIELWSPVFKKNNEIRNPIKFNYGLNVIKGKEDADNSIGKSSALLAIDFVFGGKTYLNSVAVRKLGDHSIYSCFKFNNIKYYFSRSTATPDIVTVCSQNYSPTNEKYPLSKFINFLKSNYNLNYTELSFRLGVGTFFRIANKSNLNYDLPLEAHTRENKESSISTLIKLFNLYDEVAIQQNMLNEKKEKLKVFNNARKYNFISNSITGKKQFLDNNEKIEELTYELGKLPTFSNYEIDDERIEKNNTINSLKNKYMELESVLHSKLRRLNLIDVSLDYGLYPTEADLTSLQEYFPDVNIRKIYEVEQYHKKLSKILDSEFKEEKISIEREIEDIKSDLANLQDNIKSIGIDTSIPSDFLNEYSRINTEISKLKSQNSAYLENIQLKDEKNIATINLKKSIKNILIDLQGVINEKMKEFNKILYPDIRKSPQINLKEYNSYTFFTPDDDGTGTKYKGMIVFDLALLYLTNLPALAHDSLLFKNVGDQAIAGIVKLYSETSKLNKQIFIAIDKVHSYWSETENILSQNTVLQLSDNGEELYGQSWSKGENPK